MVRHESVITALIGAALGLPLGLVARGADLRALADEGLDVRRSRSASLIVFTIVAVIAGILAAIAPARRAARLDVLEGAAVRVGPSRGGRWRAGPGCGRVPRRVSLLALPALLDPV